MSPLNGITVCVDYCDLLSLTLPYNRHHFNKFMIVTSENDIKNVLPIAHRYDADTFVTDAFYRRSASFNKWLALEEGLDALGRSGWICLIDCDILWPRDIRWGIWVDESCLMLTERSGRYSVWGKGHLITPLRRMFPLWEQREFAHQCSACEGFYFDRECQVCNGSITIRPFPSESMWSKYPIHRNINEWAGYSQIFHADDPVLNVCGNCRYPRDKHYDSLDERNYHNYHHGIKSCTRFAWHQTDWIHAGGADSIFQNQWDKSRKIRPPFDALHLGQAGVNWFGRSSPYLDGTVHPESASRQLEYMKIWERRRERRKNKMPETYDGEKLEGMK